MRRIFTIVIVSLLLTQNLSGQELIPNGNFSKDSLKIGEELQYSLSIRYPRNIDIVFPDSSYSFAPFEFIAKQSFPTVSDSISSFDSAVYTLATFEIDSIQKLEVPVFIVTGGDSVPIMPGPDSIILWHVVESIPDSVSMIENVGYANVRLAFNYPYLVVGITILVISAILVFLIFGKTISKKIRLYRLTKMHERFLTRFTAAIRELKSETDYTNFELMLADWKGYMEKLNKTPYTKLTSKEISVIYPDKGLQESLHTIDKAVYGHFEIPDLPDSFDYLRRVSEDSFHNRVNEIKNG